MFKSKTSKPLKEAHGHNLLIREVLHNSGKCSDYCKVTCLMEYKCLGNVSDMLNTVTFFLFKLFSGGKKKTLD